MRLVIASLLALTYAGPCAHAEPGVLSRGSASARATTLEPRFVPIPGRMEFSGRLIARTVRNAEASAPAHQALLALGARHIAATDEYLVDVPLGRTETDLAREILAIGGLEYVEPDWIVYPALTPNDPLYGQQWHLPKINAPAAWDTTIGAPGIVVAVVDTGVDTDHLDLAANLVSGYDAVADAPQSSGGVVEDADGHGTMVAGIIGAIGNNSRQVAGLAWGCRVMPVRASSTIGGGASISVLTRGARWAAEHGARVVNVSYEGVSSSSVQTTGAYIRSLDALLVFAAGNSGIGLSGDHADVLVVAATNQFDQRLSISNFGDMIDIAAPGDSILSIYRSGLTATGTGTSFAAPMVSATAALVWSANSSLSSSDVEAVLTANVVDLAPPGEDTLYGSGRVNAAASVQAAISGGLVFAPPFDDMFPGPQISTLKWESISGAGLSNSGVGEPSPEFALNLDAIDSVQSARINMTLLAGQTIVVSLYAQHRGVESGKSLAIEYLNNAGTWRLLDTITSDGSDTHPFAGRLAVLPEDARHAAFRLRLRALGSDGTDDWYIDDVHVGAFEGFPLPFTSSFDSTLLDTLRWPVINGAGVVTTEPGAPTPPNVLNLDNNDSIQTGPMLIALHEFDEVRAGFHVRQSGIESNESLILEYATAGGAWIQLIVVQGVGTTGSYAAVSAELPIGAKYDGVTFRLRSTSNNFADDWYIDEFFVAVTGDVGQPACPADWNDSGGIADSSDFLAYLNDWAAHAPAADLAPPGGDGVWDSSDFLAFLNLYAQGC
ncbi:MAG: S8 family serine peptidase [Phycisphaerales bacterium]|jgi:subtilisin family serine protease|nr:S8 family serine peptidase [Phycisphaerales bacterium]